MIEKTCGKCKGKMVKKMIELIPKCIVETVIRYRLPLQSVCYYECKENGCWKCWAIEGWYRQSLPPYAEVMTIKET